MHDIEHLSSFLMSFFFRACNFGGSVVDCSGFYSSHSGFVAVRCALMSFFLLESAAETAGFWRGKGLLESCFVFNVSAAFVLSLLSTSTVCRALQLAELRQLAVRTGLLQIAQNG